MTDRRTAGMIALVGLVMVLTVMVAAVTGCASQPTSKAPGTDAKLMEVASTGGTNEGTMPKKMTCPMCNKGAPAVEKGTATVENGVQVVRIVQKGGYYSPHEIALQAGMPAKLVFSGDAKDCSGKPKIAGLDKQVDFTKTGEATMDLGTLGAGTYKLTCGMDSDGGSLVVR